ncbi:glycosyltransferase family 4 protein [Neosynechococcus sphagnicola]|uniref:glycosyltransferase family 4 protein n=1 Tax=Neosynechococcus sphagnicola TaxID=1501145 RepID=UPI0030844669
METLLRAWKQAKLGLDCKLVIVGDGPMRSSLEPFYGEDLGILWLGFEPDERRRIEILRGCDVFILPSLVEGLSLSLLEAMACGLACLATDVGADGEVLQDEAGIILKTQGVSSQIRTLLPLLRDHPTWIRALGQKARQRVVESYALSANISRLEDLYGDVLSQPRVFAGSST